MPRWQLEGSALAVALDAPALHETVQRMMYQQWQVLQRLRVLPQGWRVLQRLRLLPQGWRVLQRLGLLPQG